MLRCFQTLIHFSLIFVSGIFIPLNLLESGEWILTLLSPHTSLVELFHGALNGDAFYLPLLNTPAFVMAILVFIGGAKLIQMGNS